MKARTRAWMLRAAGVIVLALVFVAYLRPSFMVDLTNRFYMCF